MTTEELLTALGWPANALRHAGTLSWTKTFGSGISARLMGASIVVTNGAVTCRMRSARLTPPYQMEPHMEAVWDIRPGKPYLNKWVVDGERRDVFDPEASHHAVAHFKSTVKSMSTQSEFRIGPVRQEDPSWMSDE